MEDGDWVVKVKRNGGGYSIIDITDKETAQALADKFNTEYQTDNYYIQAFRGRDGFAYSPNREP